MESQLPKRSRRALIIVMGGCTALIALGVFSLVGWPGTGIGLPLFGLLMIVLGGIELLLICVGKSTLAQAPDKADPLPNWELDLHETHPPLRNRIALGRGLTSASALPTDDRPARVLLESLLATGR